MIIAVALRAQAEELLVKNGDKGSYVDHKVTAKENFYSIGRLFNVHPKHLAAFNSLDMSKGLSLGQSIRIPLTDTNFIQQGQQGLPVYYMAGEKESLAKVSNSNKKVGIENLRQWNHLSNDDVSKGQKLIVGFIVSNETKNTVLNIPKKNEEEVKTKPAEEKKVDTIKTETVSKPGKTREEVRQEKIEDKKADPIVEVKNEVKPDTKGQGYFKLSFDQQVRQQPLSKEQTVTSGIFKTTSGWTDAKYYLLMSGIEPGTVVRVTNPINSKMIYAKVLGEMNSPKQGLNIRISNAAAATLGVEETDKFIVRLNY